MLLHSMKPNSIFCSLFQCPLMHILWIKTLPKSFAFVLEFSFTLLAFFLRLHYFLLADHCNTWSWKSKFSNMNITALVNNYSITIIDKKMNSLLWVNNIVYVIHNCLYIFIHKRISLSLSLWSKLRFFLRCHIEFEYLSYL